MAKTSYGICALCGKRTSKAGMTRHLKTCPAEHDKTSGKPMRLVHLRVQDAYSPLYWLDVEVKANTPLRELDRFLRGIWLECCGHLSMFRVGNTQYHIDDELADEDDPFDTLEGMLGAFPSANREALEKLWSNRIVQSSMDTSLEEVLSTSAKFSHEYDFGSTTYLDLKVINEREGRIGRAPIRLLARNDAPEFTCAVCGAPATEIDVEAMYEDENPFFCDAHAEEREMLLPVVNSPRMGVCGYTG